jgi:DNA-dependent protein kinase catalytic subunit
MNSFSSGSSQTSNQKTNYFNFDEVNQNIMDSQTEIESDDLNHHESMSSLVQLIKSLHANKITPIYENDQLPTQMPPWMEFLQKKVKDMDVHLNVKLLIVRAIINTEQFFKAYAKFWYSSLIGFLVNAFSKEDTMDYFTLDLMVVLLSWNTTALPQASDQPLIKSLFESLMKRCYHDNRLILKIFYF